MNNEINDKMNKALNELENKTTLEWQDLFKIMKRDNGCRWYATHPTAKKYIEENGYRAPSKSWPHSHSRPLLTKKFAKFLLENDKELAKELGL